MKWDGENRTMDKDYDRVMIRLSANVDEANKYLETLGLLSLDDKIDYLQNMFNVQRISKTDSPGVTEEEKIFMDYYALLHTIILIK